MLWLGPAFAAPLPGAGPRAKGRRVPLGLGQGPLSGAETHGSGERKRFHPDGLFLSEQGGAGDGRQADARECPGSGGWTVPVRHGTSRIASLDWLRPEGTWGNWRGIPRADDPLPGMFQRSVKECLEWWGGDPARSISLRPRTSPRSVKRSCPAHARSRIRVAVPTARGKSACTSGICNDRERATSGLGAPVGTTPEPLETRTRSFFDPHQGRCLPLCWILYAPPGFEKSFQLHSKGPDGAFPHALPRPIIGSL